jgi:DNA polymerase-1
MNEARNAPIQGSAADMMKLSMVYVDRAFKEEGLDAQLVLTVHDEIVSRIAKDQVEAGVKIMDREMMRAGEEFVRCVPCPVDINVAPYWGK